jgi:hypothetical protein
MLGLTLVEIREISVFGVWPVGCVLKKVFKAYHIDCNTIYYSLECGARFITDKESVKRFLT